MGEHDPDRAEALCRADARNPIFAAIGNRRRRDVLSVLLDRTGSVSEDELAGALVGAERAESRRDATAEPREDVRVDLRHVQLPYLADVGLVAWAREEGTVTTREHPALDDPRFERLLEIDAEGLDDALSALSHDDRRVLLAVLRDADAATSRTALAREVAGRTTERTDPDPEAVEAVDVSLRHAHLPALDDADFVEYDRETSSVAYAAHPALEEVFAVIHSPDEQLVDRFDGFLDGLGSAAARAREGTDGKLDWPHFWKRPHHG